ncbi:Ltp family lipoprotein [Nocardia rhamnosiphila]
MIELFPDPQPSDLPGATAPKKQKKWPRVVGAIVLAPALATVAIASAATASAAPVPASTVTFSPIKQQISAGRQNAIGSAQQYLEISAFSRSGLIDQLEYEGYSTEDATFAVDSLNVDWNEQAAKSARQYLELSSFSRSGLIDQLVYEGFTYAQAEYGANAAY